MISIIIVTYNSEKHIRSCLRSIYDKVQKYDYEIIVVDNHSGDNTVSILMKEFPNVRLIRNTKNEGFARANNKAIIRARGDYIFFLNPDTELINDAVSKLKDFILENREVGCVGARLYNMDGTHQLSCRQFPNFYNVFFGRKSIIRHAFPQNPISKKYMLANMNYADTQKVDWIMGAAIMTTRNVIDKVGLFDEQFFLFVEDTDLCYRMTMAGYDIFYYPEAHIRHHHGGSVKQGFSEAQIHHNIGMYKFFKKYSVKSPFLRVFLYMAILVRLSFIYISQNVSCNLKTIGGLFGIHF